MLGQTEQSDIRTAHCVADLSESEANDETNQPLLLDRSGVRNNLEEDQQVDDEDISRFSTCGIEVEKSAELQAHVDTGSVKPSSSNCQLSDQSFDTHSVESAVSDSIQPVKISCAESVSVSGSQAMTTEQKGVVVGPLGEGIRTRLGRLVRQVVTATRLASDLPQTHMISEVSHLPFPKLTLWQINDKTCLQ